MSLQFLEGFGGYGTGSHSDSAGEQMKLQFTSWSSAMTLTSLSSGSQGNRKYMTCGGEPSAVLKLRPSFDSTTVVVGFRIYHTAQGNFQPIWFGDAGIGFLGCINFDSGGRFQFSKPGTSDPPNDSGIPWSTKAVPTFTYAYVEVKITFHNSTGTVDYYLNGENVGSYTGLDTIEQGTSCDSIYLGYAAFYQTTWRSNVRISDIYIDDATVHGPMEVWYQAADTAGTASNFTPLASTNQSQVDDIGSDGDTTYNSSTATTTLDQIAHGDSLNVAPLALQPMVMARYVPTGSANIKVGVLSGATHDQDSAVGLGSTYDGVQGKIYETDPNTASAWTAANADAAETSYEHAA